MKNRFLQWYGDELGALRQRAADFAKRHPKLAGRLRLTGETSDDPHVERMIQAFSFTAARIRQKLEDDFPELTDTLIEALYPQYLAQIPSMSVLEMSPAADISEIHHIERGFGVETEAVRGDRCRYNTTQPVDLSPVALVGAQLSDPPFTAPVVPRINAKACLSFDFEIRGGSVALSDLDLDALTLFPKPAFPVSADLYELIMNQALAVRVARHGEDQNALTLPISALQPVAYDEDAAMLPFPLRSFPGFRLLTEFFALPEKFLFFRITGLSKALTTLGNNRFSIYIYLDQSAGKLAKSVGAETFALHCTPVVNLFEQRAEPVQIDQTTHEYDIFPDARRSATREIHSVLSVTVSDDMGNRERVQPFFGRRPGTTERKSEVYWQHKRETDPDSGAVRSKLCFVDLSLHGKTVDRQTIANVTTLAINRDLPELLPFGGGQPFLRAMVSDDRVTKLKFHLPPSRTTRFDGDDGSYWRVISHLSINHLALADNDPEQLRNLLRIYDFRSGQDMRTMIDSIVGIESRRSTARLSDGAIVSGTDITITFDRDTMSRGQAFVFGDLLSRFFALYASINTYTRIIVKLDGIVTPVARFPARSANEVLV